MNPHDPHLPEKSPRPDLAPSRSDPLSSLDAIEREVALAFLAFGPSKNRIAAKKCFPDAENRDAVKLYLDVLEGEAVQRAIARVKEEDAVPLPLKGEIVARLWHEATHGPRAASRVKALEDVAKITGLMSDGKQPGQTNVQVNIQQVVDKYKKKA